MTDIEHENQQQTQDTIQAQRMLDIAREHGLDTYLFGRQPEFCVIGTSASIEEVRWHMDRLEEFETMNDLIRRADAQINEALNMGDGVYRP